MKTELSGHADEAVTLEDVSNRNPNIEEVPRSKVTAANVVFWCRSEASYFKAPTGKLYATLAGFDATPPRTMAVDSEDFREWVRSRAYVLTGAGVKQSILEEALDTLKAAAVADKNRTVPVHVRVAKAAGSYFIDMGDDTYRAIEVPADGSSDWRIVTPTHEYPLPVKFVRQPNMHPLPEPVRGGDFQKFWQITNIEGALNRILVTAFMLECFRPDTPYPVLSLNGGPGTAKTSTHRSIAMLVDPREGSLSRLGDKADTLLVLAGNSHLIGLENVSCLSKAQQDMLCQMSTKGSASVRALYTTNQLETIPLANPVIVNGISVSVTEADLLERTIAIELKRIPADEKRAESVVAAEQERLSGEVLGGLLDVFQRTLRRLAKTDFAGIEPAGRLIDFWQLAESVGRELGYEDWSFTDAFRKKLTAQQVASAEENAVGAAIIELVRSFPPIRSAKGSKKAATGAADGVIFKGDQAGLMKAASNAVAHTQLHHAMPRSIRRFGDELRMYETSLKARGIHVRPWTAKGKKQIELRVDWEVFDKFEEGI